MATARGSFALRGTLVFVPESFVLTLKPYIESGEIKIVGEVEVPVEVTFTPSS